MWEDADRKTESMEIAMELLNGLESMAKATLRFVTLHCKAGITDRFIDRQRYDLIEAMDLVKRVYDNMASVVKT